MTKYLILGASGGLGGSILATLLSLVRKSSIIATSSRASAGREFNDKDLEFRQVDFNSRPQLTAAFAGVDRLFFVSAPTFDVGRRVAQHRNVIEAAREAGVGHVFYSSLAFGGYGDDSAVNVQ
jgi:uncharacterized protein YbjT (DUF2867 family)